VWLYGTQRRRQRTFQDVRAGPLVLRVGAAGNRTLFVETVTGNRRSYSDASYSRACLARQLQWGVPVLGFQRNYSSLLTNVEILQVDDRGT
jgi:hypothetical protein